MTRPSAHAAQRARGRARIGARLRNGRSAIGDLHMSGSSKLLFPRAQGALQAVYLNSSGGITGGDAFEVAAHVEPGAHLAMTTQAAERIYRALPGETGRVETRLALDAGARLDWLPQETIFFEGAALDRRLSIEMAPDARLLACEALIFGRHAMGEVLHNLRLRDRIDLRVDGKLVFADRLRLTGDAHETLAHPAVAAGAGAMATVIHAAPGAASQRDSLRAMLPESAGVSAISDDLLLLRLVSVDGYALRGHLAPVLRCLSGAELPRPWMI
ncbi:urease accessory protein UreD [Salipiger sp. P9]|uniref:urease accessory protein UreD n=1 Tax=Salipiger pentaromativorans TaxID=2943193 RepID=UPI0021574E81|nr:urease accessory protein UreD [Salipiger pentaromativorans]MCR8550344.1 urease accessory protein UreD [Salipiger pentaromativorans]